MSKDNKKNQDNCDSVGKKKKDAQVESHDAAAWAGIEKQKSDGKVPIPSIENVEDARDWIEENKK